MWDSSRKNGREQRNRDSPYVDCLGEEECCGSLWKRYIFTVDWALQNRKVSRCGVQLRGSENSGRQQSDQAVQIRLVHQRITHPPACLRIRIRMEVIRNALSYP